MQTLAHIPTQLRLAWIEQLAELAKDKVRWPIAYARGLEHIAHSSRQTKKIIGDDVVVFRYGDTDVLDLDSSETHESAASAHYAQILRRAAWALSSKATFSDDPLDLIRTSDDTFLTGTKHEVWENTFFSRLDNARKVLLGKGEAPTKGIFACTKCKSFDVDTEQKQTRSADEPMTIFCTCNVCGQRFVR